ncbi:MAG: Methionine-tRNA ligase [Berkelbacteria bacterium GW2011_GWA2_46_7]|uniref:Methionine--tRNA ligase n=1 Tax=Berkelbacteria bacterium GW2011_GWA2_46_7 TaxID=1618335 RepID=A0A0G1QEJ0_9BACT|nr:MAG: Methionine-tRNA ligase [Berkelbacteria bacterium GW2011_GWA2_46_7]
MNRKVLVAAAWPYVNGSLHLGHVSALLPADIIARYHRACGDDVLYVSGSDCHGTPILVTADREHVSPEAVAQRYHDEFVHTLIEQLGFSYSLYTKTMGEFHIDVAREVFQAIYEAGYMTSREERQAYCNVCQRFLPDRFVKGTCPNCGANARGDQCDNCSHQYSPEELINPHCGNCDGVPEWRPSTHLYFDLPQLQDRLAAWVRNQTGWRENAVAVTQSWLKGLQDRPVTRDLTWGVPVPVEGFRDKCIYVWFEAVTGYLSCSREWAANSGTPDAWRAWWENPQALHYYVHGKDNIPFHTIIWPAMLMTLGLRLPDRIVSSEFLKFEGVKFSKSQGIGIWLPRALAKFEPDALRFYLTLNGPETKDATFRWQDFAQRVNGDLIGNLGNFWNRTFSMTNRYFGQVPKRSKVGADGVVLLEAIPTAFGSVGRSIERSEFRQALIGILDLSRQANGYIDRREPWKQISVDKSHVAETLAVCMEVADALRRLVAPFLPVAVERLNAFLGTDDVGWFPGSPNVGLPIAPPNVIFRKIDPEIIEAEIQLMAERSAS